MSKRTSREGASDGGRAKIRLDLPGDRPPESDHVPIVQYQIEHILPTAFEHFDSVWMADHFYGFDSEERSVSGSLDHDDLGRGAVPGGAAVPPRAWPRLSQPRLIAKMAATLQTLCGGRFILGIGAGWRQEEYDAYGYEFPSTATRLRQLEEVVQICRLMWTEESPSFEGKHFQIRRRDGAAASRSAAADLHRQSRRADRAAAGGAAGRHMEHLHASQ